MLIRRSAVEHVHGFEEGFIDLFTDQAFYAKVFLSMPVFAADGCWDRYRQHPDQSCATAERTGRIRAARRGFLEWLEGYLIEHGFRGSEVWQALGSALEPYRSEAGGSMASLAPVLKRQVRGIARRVLPGPPRIGCVGGGAERPTRRRWGTSAGAISRRKTPVSGNWGLGRGLPVDRYYIEQFLARHAADIRGSVLEVGDDRYTRKFGGVAVTASGVLNVGPGHPATTIVADLSRPEQVPAGRFDCVIVTQTLQLIADLEGTVRTLHHMLRPGGVVLVTLPGISQTHYEDWGGHWRWNFTALSARTLFESAFLPDHVTVETRGNVLTATAFLHGLVAEDLRPDELDHHDRDYQVSILVRAQKGSPGD